MTDQEDARWELEVFGQARSRLEWGKRHIEGCGRHVELVGLRGRPRSTAIVVHVRENGELHELAWSLWEGELILNPGGHQDASGVGTFVYSILSDPEESLDRPAQA